MVINSMRAVFGTLDGVELTLNDGLNVVSLPNESGKSTWGAFICAMLYGINTSTQDKPVRGILAMKNKYRPWNGSLMEGVIECSFRGRDITLRRSTKSASAPMQEFSAVYSAGGDPVPGINGLNAGEVLLGMGYETFQRSSFISQASMTVSQTPELERRIQSLFSSGEERVSYTEADARLREWQRTLRYNKSGRIPALDYEISSQDSLLSSIGESARRARELSAEIEELGSVKSRLNGQLKLHIDYEANERNLRILAARTELDKASAELKEIKQRLHGDGPAPDRHVLIKYAAELEALGKKEAAVNAAHFAAVNSAVALSEYEKQLADMPFKDYTDEDALARANAAIDELYFNKRRPLSRSPVLYVFSMLLFFAGGIWGNHIGGLTLGIAFAVVAAVLAAIIMVFVFDRNNIPLVMNKRGIAHVVSEFGTDDPSEIRISISKYQAMRAIFSEMKIQCDSLNSEYEELLRDFERQSQELLTGGPFRNISTLPKAVSKTSEVLNEYTRPENAQMKYSAAEKLCESLLDAAGHETFREPDLSLHRPDGNRAQLSYELESVTARLVLLENELSMLRGKFMALGDPDVTQARLSELMRLKKGCEEDYSAIELCLSELSEANSRLRERFSPLLNARAGEIMSFLTNGRFKKLSFDRGFNAHFEIEDDIMPRKAPYMSIGSYEQLYLSLRLAICDIALDPEFSPPLILDDALVYFDDERMKRALDFLQTEASKRQVILFTCQERESEYLKTLL